MSDSDSDDDLLKDNPFHKSVPTPSNQQPDLLDDPTSWLASSQSKEEELVKQLSSQSSQDKEAAAAAAIELNKKLNKKRKQRRTKLVKLGDSEDR